MYSLKFHYECEEFVVISQTKSPANPCEHTAGYLVELGVRKFITSHSAELRQRFKRVPSSFGCRPWNRITDRKRIFQETVDRRSEASLRSLRLDVINQPNMRSGLTRHHVNTKRNAASSHKTTAASGRSSIIGSYCTCWPVINKRHRYYSQYRLGYGIHCLSIRSMLVSSVLLGNSGATSTSLLLSEMLKSISLLLAKAKGAPRQNWQFRRDGNVSSS